MKKTIISTTLASIFLTPCFVFAASENDIPSYSNSINVITGVEEQQFLNSISNIIMLFNATLFHLLQKERLKYEKKESISFRWSRFYWV